VSARLSVSSIYRPLQQRAAGLLLGARRAGDIDRQHGAQQQMRAVPRLQSPQKAEHRLVLKHGVTNKSGSTYWSGLRCRQ